MPARYLCPHCRGNRTRFALIQSISQEVEKDPHTGKILYAADEWTIEGSNGRPSLEVRCLLCGFTGQEGLFIAAAQQPE